MNDSQSILNDTNNPMSYNIDIDWERYFQEFCNAHGRYPIVYEPKEDIVLLLFPDGWMYDGLNYDGTEYPPPDDHNELMELLTYYWKRRLRIVKGEHDSLAHSLSRLKDLQRSRSLPIYQRSEIRTDEGKTETQSQKLDLVMHEKRLQWLKKDIQECKDKLTELSYMTSLRNSLG